MNRQIVIISGLLLIALASCTPQQKQTKVAAKGRQWINGSVTYRVQRQDGDQIYITVSEEHKRYASILMPYADALLMADAIYELTEKGGEE